MWAGGETRNSYQDEITGGKYSSLLACLNIGEQQWREGKERQPVLMMFDSFLYSPRTSSEIFEPRSTPSRLRHHVICPIQRNKSLTSGNHISFDLPTTARVLPRQSDGYTIQLLPLRVLVFEQTCQVGSPRSSLWKSSLLTDDADQLTRTALVIHTVTPTSHFLKSIGIWSVLDRDTLGIPRVKLSARNPRRLTA